MDVTVIDTSQLGDRSYLVHDGQVALVIDAQRDIDRLEAAVEQAGVKVAHVAETHIHNDYLPAAASTPASTARPTSSTPPTTSPSSAPRSPTGRPSASAS